MFSSPHNYKKIKDLHSGPFQTVLLPSSVALECKGYFMFFIDLITSHCDDVLEKRTQADLHSTSFKITNISL